MICQYVQGHQAVKAGWEYYRINILSNITGSKYKITIRLCTIMQKGNYQELYDVVINTPSSMKQNANHQIQSICFHFKQFSFLQSSVTKAISGFLFFFNAISLQICYKVLLVVLPPISVRFASQK